jgi:hypothetical protein
MNNQEQLNSIKQIFASSLAIHRTDENELCKKILEKEKQLERLEAKRRKLAAAYPRWTEALLKPLVDLIKIEFPDWRQDEELFQPVGLRNRVIILFTKKQDEPVPDMPAEDNPIYFCIEPGDLSKGELLYEINQTTGNPGGKVAKPIETIEELVIHLKSQIRENGK